MLVAVTCRDNFNAPVMWPFAPKSFACCCIFSLHRFHFFSTPLKPYTINPKPILNPKNNALNPKP